MISGSHISLVSGLPGAIAIIHARTALVASGLERLREMDVPASLFGGQLRTMSEVEAFVVDRVDRVNRTWFREYRIGAHRPWLLRLALANASQAFAMIGHYPDLRRFLFRGIRHRDSAMRSAVIDLAAVVAPPLLMTQPIVRLEE